MEMPSLYYHSTNQLFFVIAGEDKFVQLQRLRRRTRTAVPSELVL